MLAMSNGSCTKCTYVSRDPGSSPCSVNGAAREQHHWKAIAEQILDCHAGIRGTGIDMHEDGLPPSGREGVATRHMHRHDLMWAENDLGMFAAFRVPARDLLDQRDMVCAQIGEDVLDAEIDEPFKEIMRSAVTAHTLGLPLFSRRFRRRRLGRRCVSSAGVTDGTLQHACGIARRILRAERHELVGPHQDQACIVMRLRCVGCLRHNLQRHA